jgi:hypothetical protein
LYMEGEMGEMYLLLLVLITLLVDWYAYRYHRFEQNTEAVELKCATDTAELDGSDAHIERELENLLQKAPIEQRQQIKILEDQGWFIQEWDNGREPCFYMAPKGTPLAMILRNGRVISYS